MFTVGIKGVEVLMSALRVYASSRRRGRFESRIITNIVLMKDGRQRNHAFSESFQIEDLKL